MLSDIVNYQSQCGRTELTDNPKIIAKQINTAVFGFWNIINKHGPSPLPAHLLNIIVRRHSTPITVHQHLHIKILYSPALLNLKNAYKLVYYKRQNKIFHVYCTCTSGYTGSCPKLIYFNWNVLYNVYVFFVSLFFVQLLL